MPRRSLAFDTSISEVQQEQQHHHHHHHKQGTKKPRHDSPPPSSRKKRQSQSPRIAKSTTTSSSSKITVPNNDNDSSQDENEPDSDSDSFSFTTTPYAPPPPPSTSRNSNTSSSTITNGKSANTSKSKQATSRKSTVHFAPTVSTSKSTSNSNNSATSHSNSSNNSHHHHHVNGSALKNNSNYKSKPSIMSKGKSPVRPTTPTPATPKRHEQHHQHQARIRDHDNVEIPTAETPMNKRNAALRRGQGSTSRRTSLEKRGRRASSLGNGYSALPHPTIPDYELYRYIDQNDPPPIRMRKLVSIGSRRLLEKYQTEPLAASASNEDQLVRQLSLDGMQHIINCVCNQTLDLSYLHIQQSEPQPSSSSSSTTLSATSFLNKRSQRLPHPQNELNRTKMKELEDWNKAIKLEDDTRISLVRSYGIFREDYNKSCLKQAANDENNSSLMDIDNDDNHRIIPVMQTEQDVLNFGRQLRKRQDQVDSDNNTNKSKSKNQEEHIVQGMSNLSLQASSIRQSTHRLERLIRLADTLARVRLSHSHQLLLRMSDDSSSNDDETITNVDGANTKFSGLIPAPTSNTTTPNTNSNMYSQRRNPLDLLREISRSGNISMIKG